MAKDRLNPCIYYVCKGETCKKGFKDVTLAKCRDLRNPAAQPTRPCVG